MVNKTDLLRELAKEYAKTVKLPDDIGLSDYMDAVERETGLRISKAKATKALNLRVGQGGFQTLLVSYHGKIIRVWRKVEPKGKRKNGRRQQARSA